MISIIFWMEKSNGFNAVFNVFFLKLIDHQFLSIWRICVALKLFPPNSIEGRQMVRFSFSLGLLPTHKSEERKLTEHQRNIRVGVMR